MTSLLPRIELRAQARWGRAWFVLLDEHATEVFESGAYETKRQAKAAAIKLRDTIQRAISVPIEDVTPK